MRDQVTGMTYSDGTPAVTMSYDAAGRPLEIGNAVATDAYARVASSQNDTVE